MEPLLVVIGTGRREFREYLLHSIARQYRIHLLLWAEPTWERRYAASWTVLADATETMDATDMVDAVRMLGRRTAVTGVLAWDEARILQCATVAATLGLPGNSPDAVMRCRDKHLTRRALFAAHVPQPSSLLVHTVSQALAAAAEIGYPVVLKPRAMAASLGVVVVRGPAELARRFGFARDTTVAGAWRHDSILVERFVEGPEISVDSAVFDGQVMPMCLARKQLGYPPYFAEVGHTIDAADPLLTDPNLLALLQETHAALGVTDGVTHTEIKLTAGGPKVIEVNGRLGGGMIPYLGMRTNGIDPGLAAAAIACGRAPQLRPDRSLVGAVRFFYASRDDTVHSIAFAPAALPAAVDLRVPLVAPGAVVSPPPRGMLGGRLAYVTTVAATAAECHAAISAAAATLRIDTAAEGTTREHRHALASPAEPTTA